MKLEKLKESLLSLLGPKIIELKEEFNELTAIISANDLIECATELRDAKEFEFKMLMDVCVVDYLHFGKDEWVTQTACNKGFERGVHPLTNENLAHDKSRFAVIYHLLSISRNHRIRLKVFVPESNTVESVVTLWNCANWYEREAFDLFGILFNQHPDLRRLLTDYGFIGHPFRKDFPLVGNVEVRYDAAKQRVVYEPVDIVPRTLVPKVIRENHHE